MESYGIKIWQYTLSIVYWLGSIFSYVLVLFFFQYTKKNNISYWFVFIDVLLFFLLIFFIDLKIFEILIFFGENILIIYWFLYWFFFVQFLGQKHSFCDSFCRNRTLEKVKPWLAEEGPGMWLNHMWIWGRGFCRELSLGKEHGIEDAVLEKTMKRKSYVCPWKRKLKRFPETKIALQMPWKRYLQMPWKRLQTSLEKDALPLGKGCIGSKISPPTITSWKKRLAAGPVTPWKVHQLFFGVALEIVWGKFLKGSGLNLKCLQLFLSLNEPGCTHTHARWWGTHTHHSISAHTHTHTQVGSHS